jgi:CheY-like chemotaxis protein
VPSQIDVGKERLAEGNALRAQSSFEGALSATRDESINLRGAQPGGKRRAGVRGRGLRPEFRHRRPGVGRPSAELVLQSGAWHHYLNYQIALSHFREHYDAIDLVLLDLVLPKMNGPETFRQMMEIDAGVQVLVVSGYSLDGEAQKLIDAGTKGFLQKPFTIAELAGAIGTALR